MEVSCAVAIQTKMDIIQTINWSNTSDDWIVLAGKEKHAVVFSAVTGK